MEQRWRINGMTCIDGSGTTYTYKRNNVHWRKRGTTYTYKRNNVHWRTQTYTRNNSIYRITDFGERCLPLSSQPSNSAEFLLHTAAQRMSNNKSVTQQLSARRVYFKHTTTRPLTADPRPTSDFWTGTRFTGLAQLSCGVDVQYFLSIFVIFLLFALKIWHKRFVLFRFSKIWKKGEFSILPIFENFFLFFAYFAINRKRRRLTQKSFCISCWTSLTLLLT